MKAHPIITSTFIAGALLLLGTGCADAGKDTKNDNANVSPSSASATATPSSSSTVAATPDEDKSAVLKSAQSFYDTIKDKAVIDKLKESTKDFGVEQPSDEKLKKLVADNPQPFSIFDTSTSENIKNAYVQLVMGASIANMGEDLKFTVAPEAVKIDDSTHATVDPTYVQVFSGDKLLNDPKTTEVVPAPEDSKVKAVKQDGKWILIPLKLQGDEPVPSTSSSPSPSPSK